MNDALGRDGDHRREGAAGSEQPPGDRESSGQPVRLVGVVVAIHLLVAGLHGAAHGALAVALPEWLAVAVLLTVYALPVVGFLLLWRGIERLGIVTFTGAMAASLLVGGVLHFVVQGPDHISHIAAGPWRFPFSATAVALAATEAVGAGLGGWYWARRGSSVASSLPDSARIDGVPDAGGRPLTRLAYWFSRTELGEVAEPLTVTAHSPRVLVGYSGFEFALDGASHLDEELKELAELKAATVIGCEYCIDIGSALGSDAGLTEAQLRDLTDPTSDTFGNREWLVLRYAEAMTRTPADVPDELFASLAEAFDEAELVELTAAIAFENYRGRFNHAVGLDPQGFAADASCPVPEPTPGFATSEADD